MRNIPVGAVPGLRGRPGLVRVEEDVELCPGALVIDALSIVVGRWTEWGACGDTPPVPVSGDHHQRLSLRGVDGFGQFLQPELVLLTGALQDRAGALLHELFTLDQRGAVVGAQRGAFGAWDEPGDQAGTRWRGGLILLGKARDSIPQ